MTQDHEYALLGGFNRSHLGRWIFMASAAVSGLLVFVLLSFVNVAAQLGWPVNLPPTALSVIGAGSVYLALYFLFDKFAWKVGPISRLLKIPDIAGTWRCEGLSTDKTPNVSWAAEVKITQSWDRVRVHLKTDQSESNSVAAALVCDPVGGHRLMYHYKNEPKQGEVELHAHHGFGEIVFSADGTSAYGEYFNGRGRNTYGRMTLTRR
jgi:hypothetical protein